MGKVDLEHPIYPLSILTTIDGTSRKFIMVVLMILEELKTNTFILLILPMPLMVKLVVMTILKSLSPGNQMIMAMMNLFVFMDIVKI